MARHLPHFRRLVLDDSAPKAALDHALSLIPLLPHLREISLTQDTAKTIFNDIEYLRPAAQPVDPSHETSDCLLSCAAFRDAVARVPALKLANFGAFDAESINGCFTGLKALHLVDGALNNADLALAASLPTLLANLESLTSLTLEAKNLSIGSEWLEPIWTPALTSLSLVGLVLSPHAHQLVELFAPSLTTLHIDLSRGPTGAGTQLLPSLPIFTTAFPLLETLSVQRMSMETLHHLLAALSTSPVTFELSGPETIPPSTFLASLRPFAATLVTLRAVRFRRKSKITSVANKLARFADTRGIHLSADSRHDPFLYRMGAEEVRDGDKAHRVERRCESMLDTIEWGRRWVERMQREKDFAGT